MWSKDYPKINEVICHVIYGQRIRNSTTKKQTNYLPLLLHNIQKNCLNKTTKKKLRNVSAGS